MVVTQINGKTQQAEQNSRPCVAHEIRIKFAAARRHKERVKVNQGAQFMFACGAAVSGFYTH